MDQDPKPSPSVPKDHESFFLAASLEDRRRLEAIQALVAQRVPDAERCVSYGMPAFWLSKVFFYFAAFKKHIGVCPPVKEPPALIKELAAYRGPKGNLSFPHSAPLPLELIGRVAVALTNQYGRRV